MSVICIGNTFYRYCACLSMLLMLWGKLAIMKKSEYPEISTWWGTPNWPHGKATWKDVSAFQLSQGRHQTCEWDALLDISAPADVIWRIRYTASTQNRDLRHRTQIEPSQTSLFIQNTWLRPQSLWNKNYLSLVVPAPISDP